jgi:site-specific DNA-methyltransferase (adenine-specific)
MTPYHETEAGVLYLGDCLDVMAWLPAAYYDAVVTDPPFAFAGGASNGLLQVSDDQFFRHWWNEVARSISRVLTPCAEGFIWCDWRSSMAVSDGFVERNNARNFPQVKQMLYHNRMMIGMGKPFRNCVDMIAYIRGPRATGERIPNTTPTLIESYWYYGKHKHHPAEKSVAVCRQLVEWSSDEGTTVIDPFAGSGTSLVACVERGRRYVGIEKDERYCEEAAKRIDEALLSNAALVQPRLPLDAPREKPRTEALAI